MPSPPLSLSLSLSLSFFPPPPPPFFFSFLSLSPYKEKKAWLHGCFVLQYCIHSALHTVYVECEFEEDRFRGKGGGGGGGGGLLNAVVVNALTLLLNTPFIITTPAPLPPLLRLAYVCVCACVYMCVRAHVCVCVRWEGGSVLFYEHLC